MKVLTLTEPWATLVALQLKRIETRSWRAYHRGPLAIHASKTMPIWAIQCLADKVFYEPLIDLGVLPKEPLLMPAKDIRAAFPLGKIIAVGTQSGCFEFGPTTDFDVGEPESIYGDFTAGRFGFRLEGMRRLAEPIPARGALGFWDFNLPEGLRYAAV